MKKYCNISILFLLICSLSCSTKQNTSFSKSLIKSISEEDKNYPSRFFNLLFFCKCQNNEILLLNVYELREVYLSKYSHTNYETFLTDLLNQRIAIQCSNPNKVFKIDETIHKRYKEIDINEFVNLYCTKKRDNLFWLKKDFTDNQRNTILYLLFINNYLTSIDDHSGSFIIRKMI